MKQVVIIGFGRFGQLLAGLLSPSFDLAIVETNPKRQDLIEASGYRSISMAEAHTADTIFLAVPISALEPVIQELAPIVSADQLIIDIASVKVYPASLMRQYLPHCQTLATHPLFGPDSARDGLAGLKLAVCPIKVEASRQQFWTEFWEEKGVEVIVTTPEAHDKDTVYSQGLAYTLAKSIEETHISEVTFSTRSYDKLLEIAGLSAYDSEQLFHDVLYYNPYFAEMKQVFEQAYGSITTRLNAIDAEVKAESPVAKLNTSSISQ